MIINRRLFPSILLDNEEVYLGHLEGVISSVDEYAIMEVVKGTDSYLFRLVPSLPRYTNMLLQEILKIHSIFSIHLDISKSIKVSGAIVFKIQL